jgi:hypothetical protein
MKKRERFPAPVQEMRVDSLPALLYIGYFQDRVLQTICLGWPQTAILLISAFWVARITAMSHGHSAILASLQKSTEWKKNQVLERGRHYIVCKIFWRVDSQMVELWGQWVNVNFGQKDRPGDNHVFVSLGAVQVGAVLLLKWACPFSTAWCCL